MRAIRVPVSISSITSVLRRSIDTIAEVVMMLDDWVRQSEYENSLQTTNVAQ
jgi:hypothetical protein